MLIGPTYTMDQGGDENQNLVKGYSDQAELKISANPKVSGGLAGRLFCQSCSAMATSLIMMTMIKMMMVVIMMMMVVMTMVMVVSSADL